MSPGVPISRCSVPRKRGRAAGLFLVGCVFLLALFASFFFGRDEAAANPRGAGDGRLPEETHGFGWAEGEQEVYLLPLRVDPAGQASYAQALIERYGLPVGEAWRLRLPQALMGDADPVVVDADGAEMRRLFFGEEHQGDPLSTLLSTPLVGPGIDQKSFVLWGPAPREPTLVLGGRRLSLSARAFETDRWKTGFSEFPLGEEAPRQAAADGAEMSWDPAFLREENQRLRAELDAERERRLRREREWYAYNRALAELEIEPKGGSFAVDEELVPEAAEEADAAESASGAGTLQPEAAEEADPAELRLTELDRSLRAFLALADLQSYDLIEIGQLHADAPLGGVGPVLFRILDDRGRLSGGLFAERLRMEGSRSGRTVTLVLEEGYESHGGLRTPFESGARRIPVPFLDPAPWFDSCPELFPEKAFAEIEDDGHWDREALRREMNRLLALDTSMGWFRVRGIGGVVRDRLTDVQLEVLDTGGRLTRRLFADSARIEVEPPGIVIRLENGVIVRGDQKEPFRDGRYEIYLPRADPEDWREAALPGFEEEPEEREG